MKAGKADKMALVERDALCRASSPFVVKVHYAFQVRRAVLILPLTLALTLALTPALTPALALSP